jgi:hypothetical protein
MSHVVQLIKTCMKCYKSYTELQFRQLPKEPDNMFGAKGLWPACINEVGSEICGCTGFYTSDDSDDDE